MHNAIEFLGQALAISREMGDRRGQSYCLGNLATAYYKSGIPRKAVDFYDQAIMIDREIGNQSMEATDLWNSAAALYDSGDRKQAISRAEIALRIRETNRDPAADKVRRRLDEWRKAQSDPIVKRAWNWVRRVGQ